MNELQIFSSEEFGQVRTVEINGKPYFVANDVAKALGYVETAKSNSYTLQRGVRNGHTFKRWSSMHENHTRGRYLPFDCEKQTSIGRKI